MKAFVQVFLNLLKSEITKTPLDLSESLTEKDLFALYNISKRHDLAHFVAYALEKNNLLNDNEICQKLKREKKLAIFRYFKLDTATKDISQAFEEEKIKFIPLKGSVVRELYPEPWMRTSCDIDILIKKEDLERAGKILSEKLSFTFKEKNFKDASFFSPDKTTHLELHYDMSSWNQDKDLVFKEIWNMSYPIESGSYHYVMPDELFYFHHISHMARHFEGGGCGVRPFIDLWILNHNVDFSAEKRTELLEKANLVDFDNAVTKLSEIWFGDDQHNDLTKQIESYILKSGVYGDMENRLAVSKATKGNGAKHIFSRLWIPYKSLKYKYPSLDGRPYLLIFYEVYRYIEILFNGRFRHTISEVKTVNKVSDETQKDTLSMLEQLKLR